MGGDHAPKAPVAGALEALAEINGAHTIQLVGRASVIEEQLGAQNASADARKHIEIVDAPDVVEMTDKPTDVRKKPNSSMWVGLKIQTEGKSDAFISAGNTRSEEHTSELQSRRDLVC